MRRKKPEPPEKTQAEPTKKLQKEILNHFLAGTGNAEMEMRNPQLTPNMINKYLRPFLELVFEQMEKSVDLNNLEFNKKVYDLAKTDFFLKMVGPKRVYFIVGTLTFSCYGEQITMLFIDICKRFREEGNLGNLKEEIVRSFLEDVYQKYIQFNPFADQGSKYHNVEKPDEKVKRPDEDEIKIVDKTAEKKMDKSIVEEEPSSKLQERVVRKYRPRPPAVFRQRKDVPQRRTETISFKKKESQVSLNKQPEKTLTTSEKKIALKQTEDPEQVRSNVEKISQNDARKKADQKAIDNTKSSVSKNKNESTKKEEEAPKRKRERKHILFQISSDSNFEEVISPKKKQKTDLSSKHNNSKLNISSNTNLKKVQFDEERHDPEIKRSPWTESEVFQLAKMIGQNLPRSEIKKRLVQLFGSKVCFQEQSINQKRQELFETCKTNFLMKILDIKLVKIPQMNKIEDILERIDQSREFSFINSFIGRYQSLQRGRPEYKNFPENLLHETIDELPKIKVLDAKDSPIEAQIVGQQKNLKNLTNQRPTEVIVESYANKRQPKYKNSQARSSRRGLDDPIPVFAKGRRKTQTQGLKNPITVYAKGNKTEKKKVETSIPEYAKGGSQAIRSTSKSLEKISSQPKRKLSKTEQLNKKLEKTLRVRNLFWFGSKKMGKKQKKDKKSKYDRKCNEDE